jgi:hypothetical protein
MNDEEKLMVWSTNPEVTRSRKPDADIKILKMSEALKRGIWDGAGFPWARYGYSGDVTDVAALIDWLQKNPVIDADYEYKPDGDE